MEDKENIEVKIKKLVKLAKELGLSSLSVEDEQNGISFELAGNTSAKVIQSSTETKVMPPLESNVDAADEGMYVVAPFNGTYYNSPSPDSPVFVKGGSRVANGDVLCIVEAMKVMNEIQAESDGVIKKILKENGQTVEKGDPLFLIT